MNETSFISFFILIILAFFVVLFALFYTLRRNPKAPLIFLVLGVVYSSAWLWFLSYFSGEGNLLFFLFIPFWPHFVVHFFLGGLVLGLLLLFLDHSSVDFLIEWIATPIYIVIWTGIGYLIGLRVKNGRKKNS